MTSDLVPTSPGWTALRTAMAAPAMRLGHMLWHQLRSNWWRVYQADRDDFTRRFGPDWAPPRPALYAEQTIAFDNDSGCDFLAMHHHMVMSANDTLTANGDQPVNPWPVPPPSNDPIYQPPKSGRDALLRPGHEAKDDAVWEDRIRCVSDRMQPDRLRRVSISHLGAWLEFGIHNTMHERFGGYATNGQLRNNMQDLWRPDGPDWNDAAYDTLLDPYSAHVHPWFWQIHGWIDACCVAWEAATGQHSNLDHYWHGPMHAAHTGDVAKLEDAARRLAGCVSGVAYKPIASLFDAAGFYPHLDD